MILLCLPHLTISQENCWPIENCPTELKIEFVKLNDNVTSGCSLDGNGGFCSGGNDFRQISYKVYLRYQPSTDISVLEDFLLEYKQLHIEINLSAVSGTNSISYSFIDKEATSYCQAWNPHAVLFDVEDKTVSIDFENFCPDDDPSNPCHTNPQYCGDSGEGVLFTWNQPPGAAGCAPQGQHCAWAELFTVVVNAYPHESFQLTCGNSMFTPYFDNFQPSCNSIPCHNGAGSFPVFNVNAPASAQGTANADLEIRILPAVLNGGTPEFPIEVAYDPAPGTSLPVTLSYLEFLMLLQTSKELGDPDYLLATPHGIKLDDLNRQLHYLIDLPSGLQLNPGESKEIARIRINPPNLMNSGYSVNLVFLSQDESRVISSAGCTNLPVASGLVTYTVNGTPECAGPESDIRFHAFFDSWQNCSTPEMKIGFYSNSHTAFSLKQIEIQVDFSLNGAIHLMNADYTDWDQTWGCANNSSSCFNDAGVCDEVSDNSFRFCWAADATHAIHFDPDGYITLRFQNDGGGCIEGMTLRKLYVSSATGTGICIPEQNIPDPDWSECPPQLSGQIATESGETVEDVIVEAHCNTQTCPSTPPPPQFPQVPTSYSSSDGHYGVCQCETCLDYTVVPYKNNDPLNGVSTFDLVLINQHILGLVLFTSPYTIIAADANRSRSLSTFDIVELRKLILGIYTELPNCPAWLFIDRKYQFPNPFNPFQEIFPETVRVENINDDGKNVDFIAVKVGDVNDNVIGHSKPAQGPPVSLDWAIPAARTGKFLTIPVQYTGTETLEALQLGMHFDPEQLEYVNMAPGEVPGFTPDNFGLTKLTDGEIRLSWFATNPGNPDLFISPGAMLFYLKFRVLHPSTSAAQSLKLDDRILSNLAWRADATECPVVNSNKLVSEKSGLDRADPFANQQEIQVVCRPNPTAGEMRFSFTTAKETNARLDIFDTVGNRVSGRQLALKPGTQEIALPEIAGLPAGMYKWRLSDEAINITGNLVKI